jgi:hypothetical protein
MLKSLTRASAALLVAVSFGFSVVPAAADQSQALATGVVSGANTAIRNAMDAKKAQPQPSPQRQQQDNLQPTLAQVPPVNQQPVGGAAQAGLPTGLTYFADLSIAYPWGDIGTAHGKWLQGGMDAMAAYGFNPTSRVVASFYQLQHYPYGFNSGTVPLFLPNGLPAAGCVNLNGVPANGCGAQNLDLTTKDSFLLLSYEKLLLLGKIKDRPVPLVVTPTYVSRWSQINASGQPGSDVVPFVNPLNGLPVTGVPTRSAQYWSVAFTAPFLKSPKFFGTFTLAPTWLVHLAGVNQQNTAQLYQILYLEYSVNNNLRLFLEPQSSRDYLPTDPYAQHLAAYFFGATQRLGKNEYVQVVLNSGGPTNYSPYGIKYFQCYSLPCSASTVPAIGGLKATQLQVQFGVGSPVVLPF